MPKRFCGCCELKVGCIIVALCRIVVTVAASVAVFVIYFDDELKQEILRREFASEGALISCMIMSIPVCIVTIRCSYFFIRGAISSNKDDIRHMYPYILIHFATFVMLVLCFNLICFSLAIIEFYLMCYSGLLIRERKGLLGEVDALNGAETPPPQYDSCAGNIPTQTSPVIYRDEGESSQNATAEADTNAGVETEENSFIKTTVNQQVNPFEMCRMESKESAEKDPDENSTRNGNSLQTQISTVHRDVGESSHSAGTDTEEKPIMKTAMNQRENPFRKARMESDEKSIQNVAREGNSFENAGFESEENSVNP